MNKINTLDRKLKKHCGKWANEEFRGHFKVIKRGSMKSNEKIESMFPMPGFEMHLFEYFEFQLYNTQLKKFELWCSWTEGGETITRKL